jgi:hypothetical protein
MTPIEKKDYKRSKVEASFKGFHYLIIFNIHIYEYY